MTPTYDIHDLAQNIAKANTAAVSGWQKLTTHWLNAGVKSMHQSATIVQKVSSAKSPAELLEIHKDAVREVFAGAVDDTKRASEIFKSTAADVSSPFTAQMKEASNTPTAMAAE